MTLDWREKKQEFASGEDAYLGRWKVGGWFWDDTVPDAGARRYRPTCSLPAKFTFRCYTTGGEAKQAVEHAVGAWVRDAGLVEQTADAD